MSFTCCCTNQCPACGACCQFQCSHRRSMGQTYPIPNVPYTPAPRPKPRPVEVQIVQPKPPLTEDDIKRLIREGIREALDEIRELNEGV